MIELRLFCQKGDCSKMLKVELKSLPYSEDQVLRLHGWTKDADGLIVCPECQQLEQKKKSERQPERTA